MNTKIFLLVVLCIACQFSGIAQPANDDPCNAALLGISTSCNSMTYTTTGATATAGAPAPGCGNYSGGDVWFRFTMPDNGYHVVLEMEAADILDGGLAVYTGTCAGLNPIQCDDNSGVGNMPSLKVDDGCSFVNAGTTYWVRAWENGNDTSGNFGICAYAEAPDAPAGASVCGVYPPAGNTCCDAVLLSDLLDGYCGNTGGYSDNPSTIPGSGFCGQIENNSWLAFRASDTNVSIEINISNCLRGNGIQSGIFQTSDCTNFNLVSNCSNINNYAIKNLDTLSASGLTIGETYYLMVDGWASDTCDYSLRVINGVEMTTVTASDEVLCAGESTTLQTNTSGLGPYTYAWSPAGSLDDPMAQNPLATPTASTDYTVTVTDGNGSTAYTISILVYPGVPGTAVILGDTSICVGTTIGYTASATEAASYTWTTSGGGTSTPNNSSLTVDWTIPGDYSLCVTPANECGNGAQVCRTVHVVDQPNLSATDPAPACAPNTIDLATILVNNSSTGTGPLTYHSSATDAASGTAPLASTVISTSGRYWIRMATLPDCFDTVSVNLVIEDPQITVFDPARTCQPQTIDLATVILSEANGLSGTRSYFADSTDAVNSSNVLSSGTVNSTGRYFIRYETGNGCFDVAGVAVNIDTVPMVNTIGPIMICAGDLIDLDTITINESNNATIASKKFFSSKLLADVDLFELASTVVSADTFYMRVETAFGCFDVDTIFIDNYPTVTGAISGNTTVCPGDSADLVFNFSEPGLHSGTYSDGSTNFNFTDLQDGESIRIQVNSNTTYTLDAFTDSHACVGTIGGSPVTLQVHSTPTASISGTASICEGQDTDLTFTMTGNPPFNIVFNDGTNNVLLTGINSGTTVPVMPTSNTTYSLVSVEDANGCSGTISGSATVTLIDTVQITNFNITCNPQKTSYVVSFDLVGGDLSSYLVTGSTGNLTGSSFVSDPINSNTPYSFTVGDASACPSIVVSGTHECACLTDAGSMDPSPLTACENAMLTAIHNADATLEAGDVLSFVLHDGSGTTLGQVFGMNSLPVFGREAGMSLNTTYYISAVAGPDNGSGLVDTSHTCAVSSVGTPVQFTAIPVAVLSGGGAVCPGANSELIFNFTAGTGPFDIVYTDGTNQFTLNGIADGHRETVQPATDQTYTLVSVVDNTTAACVGTVSGNALVQFVTAVDVDQADIECNGNSTEFRLVIQLIGGDPSTTTVNGGTGTYDVTTHSFVSDWMPNGTTYTFSFTDGNNCTPGIVTGTHICNCITLSGTMSNNPLTVCGDATATATYNNDGAEDTDDVRAYYLHDQPGTSLGNVMAVSQTPEFTYSPTMTYGTTYYISTVVGNDDGSGFPNLTPGSDRCLSVSEGQPITFYPTPTATISGSTTICQDEDATLLLSLTGVAPFTVAYTDGTDTITLMNLQDGDPITVNPQVTTTYRLLSVLGSDPEPCTGLIDPMTAEATVTVIERPQINNWQVECNASSTAYRLTFDVSGGQSNNYIITGDTSLTLLAGTTFQSSWYISGDSYQLSIDDGGSCPVVMLSGTEFCLCTPDIQPNITVIQGVSCPGDLDATLLVSNLNGQAPFSYVWSTGDTDTLITDLGPGTYHVTMTDGNGCESTDSVSIEDATFISAEVFTRDPDCSGRANGLIQLNNVSGGAGQYSYYLDGTFSPTGRIFNSLEANVPYVLTIEDANGCTWEDTVSLNEAEPFTVDIGEDTTITLGDSLFLQIRPSSPIDTFIWGPAQILPCVNCSEMIVKPEFSVTYTMTVTSADGLCRASDEMRVTVNREVPVYVPNVFSPNGDFRNERFTVYGGSGVTQVKVMRVFNRWGEMVFEARNFPAGREELGWDGRKGVEELPVGVYIYYAEVQLSDGTSERVEGDVTLIR